MAPSTLTSAFVFTSGVIMGTAATITIKVLYGFEAIGLSGDEQRFEKPLFMTMMMFVAMMLALPVFFIERYIKQRKLNRKNAQPLLLGNEKSEELEEHYEVPWRTYFLLVIPAAFDLLGTALSQAGLLYTTVSVYQLLRCSVIIVTALLKTSVLGHKLTRYMWAGIVINTLAMVLVSATSYFDPEMAGGDASALSGQVEPIQRDPKVGIMLIILSCIVQGSQYVFEEKVMSVDNAHPLIVVGMEGVWGTVLMPLVVFPWAYILPGTDYGGCIENFSDALVMLNNSKHIQYVLAGFTITVFLYNIFCIYVTYLLNSVWHAILDNFRPVSVWSTDLLLFYVFTNGRFGEEWSMGSWLELLGMLLLFVGTGVYNGTLLLPGFSYPSDFDDGDVADGSLIVNSPEMEMSSPYLALSPLITPKSRVSRRQEGNPIGIRQFGSGPTNWPSYGYGSLGASGASPQMNGFSLGRSALSLSSTGSAGPSSRSR